MTNEATPAAPGFFARAGGAVLFLSASLFALMGVQVKALTTLLPPGERLPDMQVTFTRFAFGLIVMIALAALGLVRLRSERPLGLLLRGLFGTVAISLYFYSITHGELTKGTLLTYTYLIFAPLFSALWLREWPTRSAFMALATATAGIVLVMNPDFSHVSGGDVAGLGSGIFSGMAITTIRDLRRTEAAPVIFFSLCLCGTIAVGAMLALVALGVVGGVAAPRVPHASAFLLLIGVGLTSTAGQLILTWGFRYTSTALGSLISVTTVPLSALAGVLFFGERLHWNTLAGALLILAAGAYLSLHEVSAKRRQVVS